MGLPNRRFPRFEQLPINIRRMIWGHVNMIVQGGEPDIIEVAFTREPTYHKPDYLKRRPARVVWKYKCFQLNPSWLGEGILGLDAQAAYLVRHPNILRLNQQRPIRFNRLRDTIYFDASSFAALWFYAQHHRWEFFGDLDHLLRGFNLIQILGSYHADDSTANRQGLENLMNDYGIFPSLKRVRLLGLRNYLPARIEGQPVRPGGTILDDLKDENEGQLAKLRDFRLQNGRFRYKAMQRACIQRHFDTVDDSLDIFDAEMDDDMDIPEGP